MKEQIIKYMYTLKHTKILHCPKFSKKMKKNCYPLFVPHLYSSAFIFLVRTGESTSSITTLSAPSFEEDEDSVISNSLLALFNT